LDTNILIYLISTEDIRKHDIAKKFISNEQYEVFISMQNIKEFSNVALKKSSKSIEKIQSTIDIFLKAFYVFNEMVDDVFHAIKITSRKSFYDALLISTMTRNGVTTIITENEKDFSNFEGIKVINPFR